MKTNQQNEKLNTLLRTTIMCLLVLTGTMQMHAIDYNNTYHSQYPSSMGVTATYGNAYPSASFQSTSAYASDEWSQSTTPMLNVDGSVSAGAYMGGPHKAGPGSTAPNGNPVVGPGTPGGTLDPNAQQPIGDALLPLLACALLYILARRRKSAI